MERALLRKDMKFFHQKKERKNPKITTKNSAKCAKRLKGEVYPAKSSAQCSFLPVLAWGPYLLGSITHFLSVLSASLLDLWVSTLALVPCSSYFKPWLRSQVSLGGLFPRNTPDSGHLAAWTHQAPECPGVTKQEIVKMTQSFLKSRYYL